MRQPDFLKILLTDERRFGFIKWIIGGILLLVLTGLNFYLFSQSKKFFYGEYDIANIEDAIFMGIALSDYAYDIFLPHQQEMTRPLPADFNDQARKDLLGRLANLPGVSHAFILGFDDSLSMAFGSPPPLLRDSLILRRNIFKQYRLGGIKHPRKFHNWIFNQVRLENITLDKDTLRLIIAAWDSSGAHYRVIHPNSFQPGLIKTLAAVQIDEHWVKQTLSSRLDTLFFDRQVFALWSNADPKDTSETHGAGILAFGDTLWWTGIRNIEAKSRAEGFVSDWPWPSCNWFSFRTIVSNDKETMLFPKQQHRIFIGIIVFADLILVSLIYITLLAINQLRRRWVNQQLALGHLAHSIRTPVSRIRINIDSLAKNLTASPEEEQEVIAGIDSECQRLEGAVKRTALTLEGIGNRTVKTQCDLSSIAREAENRWKINFRRQGVILSVADLPETCYVKGDAELLSALLDNLLDNALRHTSLQKEEHKTDHLEVNLGIKIHERHACLSVDDQGGGIKDSDRKLIFRRFGKPQNDAGTAASGLGLGLALVREIARAHGGDVELTPNTRGGSIFIVNIPLNREV